MVTGNDLVGGWGWGGHAGRGRYLCSWPQTSALTNGSVSADGIAAIIPIFPSGDD